MWTMWSLRTSKIVVVAAGFVACGPAFSSGAATAADAGSDSSSAADAHAEVALTRFCNAQVVSSTALCDDFDDRTDGQGLWTTQSVSAGASIAFDSTSVSAPHALLATAGSSLHAVLGYSLSPSASALVADMTIKVEKNVVATSTMRFASLASQNLDDFRLDLVKNASNVYELRMTVNGAVAGDAVELKGMEAIESDWHRVTWKMTPPAFTPKFAAGKTEIAVDDKKVGEMTLSFATDTNLITLAAVFRKGLTLFVGVNVPAGKSEAAIRFDNVAITVTNP